MILRDAYINIQQGLQNIAAFVNKQITVDELDVYWAKCNYKFIDLIFMSKEERNKPENIAFQEVQAILDDLKILQIKDYSTALVPFGKGMYIPFPANYAHLINDRTLVAKTCDGCNGGLEQTKEVINRETKTESLYNKLDNTMSKTSEDSPISELAGGNLYVYNMFRGQQQFRINNIVIDYLRKPVPVKFNDVTFPNGATVLEFPETTCYKLIDLCVKYISIVTQQNQNKIQNLKAPL